LWCISSRGGGGGGAWGGALGVSNNNSNVGSVGGGGGVATRGRSGSFSDKGGLPMGHSNKGNCLPGVPPPNSASKEAADLEAAAGLLLVQNSPARPGSFAAGGGLGRSVGGIFSSGGTTRIGGGGGGGGSGSGIASPRSSGVHPTGTSIESLAGGFINAAGGTLVIGNNALISASAGKAIKFRYTHTHTHKEL